MNRRYRVIETSLAFDDYIKITEHIGQWTDDWPLAVGTVELIREYIKGMSDTPHRGTKRDDLRPGLRIVPFRKRTIIAFEIDDTAMVVSILRVFYGGQDYEAVMRPP